METLQVPSELAQMTDLYRERAPRRVLEIGVWDGGTLKVWLEEEPDFVLAVDLEHRNKRAYAKWRRPATDLKIITGSSQSERVKRIARRAAPYDWVFIDGDHNPGPALADTELALEVAAPGGLILIHDIVTCWVADVGWSVGPAEAFEFARSQAQDSWTYLDPEPMRWGHGIGVVALP